MGSPSSALPPAVTLCTGASQISVGWRGIRLESGLIEFPVLGGCGVLLPEGIGYSPHLTFETGQGRKAIALRHSGPTGPYAAPSSVIARGLWSRTAATAVPGLRSAQFPELSAGALPLAPLRSAERLRSREGLRVVLLGRSGQSAA